MRGLLVCALRSKVLSQTNPAEAGFFYAPFSHNQEKVENE